MNKSKEDLHCILCGSPIMHEKKETLFETKMCGWCAYDSRMFDEYVTWPELKNRIQKSEDPGLKTFIVEGPFTETFTKRGYPVRPFFRAVCARPMEIEGIQKREGSVAYCIYLPE
jgi:hypothetical protein